MILNILLKSGSPCERIEYISELPINIIFVSCEKLIKTINKVTQEIKEVLAAQRAMTSGLQSLASRTAITAEL